MTLRTGTSKTGAIHRYYACSTCCPEGQDGLQRPVDPDGKAGHPRHHPHERTAVPAGASGHDLVLTLPTCRKRRILAYVSASAAGLHQSVISRGFYTAESTWLPTIIGAAIALAVAPIYVVARQQIDAIGLAVASSTTIMGLCPGAWLATAATL